MSGVLDVAVYSDTTAEESIDGVEGFNFRALTPGITADDRRRIREEMLHRVHPTWAHDHDELAHPPTAAYVTHDGRRYLARGHSTGLTLSGRPGNLVTQVLVSDDPAAFGSYQPAQLYAAATVWTLADSPSGELPPWPTPDEVRPDFEADALRAMLRDDPWAAQVLSRYLTMLEMAAREAPYRLVLLHRDLDVVMRWLAAGTVLLGDEVAGRLSFRALVDDPSRTDAAVVGVSPEFELEPIVGVNRIDLERRTATDLPPSDTAAALAAALLAEAPDDRSAFDLADRWEPAVGPDLAARAASALHGAIPTVDAWTVAVELIEALEAAPATDELRQPHPTVVAALAAWSPATAEEIRTARETRDRARRVGAAELADVLDRVTSAGLERVVGALARDLRAHDRAAELAIVNGTWDWLADEPDATAVHPWIESALVGHLPREQRADALAGVKLRIATWPIAIGRPLFPRDNRLVAAWLRHQGIDARLAGAVRNGLLSVRGSQGGSDASYDELLDAVLHAPFYGADFPDTELAQLAMDYAEVHERITTAQARVKDRANTTLKPLLTDLEEWGSAVAPFLGDLLLDAVDLRAVEYVSAEAGDWAREGVRSAFRRRFAAAGKSASGRSDVVMHAVKVGSGAYENMAAGAVDFLTDDLKSSTLTRIRTDWERPERDRLDALLRSARPDKRRGLGGRFGKAKGA